MAENVRGCCTVGADHRRTALVAANQGFCFYLGYKNWLLLHSEITENYHGGGRVGAFTVDFYRGTKPQKKNKNPEKLKRCLREISI